MIPGICQFIYALLLIFCCRSLASLPSVNNCIDTDHEHCAMESTGNYCDQVYLCNQDCSLSMCGVDKIFEELDFHTVCCNGLCTEKCTQDCDCHHGFKCSSQGCCLPDVCKDEFILYILAVVQSLINHLDVLELSMRRPNVRHTLLFRWKNRRPTRLLVIRPIRTQPDSLWRFVDKKNSSQAYFQFITFTLSTSGEHPNSKCPGDQICTGQICVFPCSALVPCPAEFICIGIVIYYKNSCVDASLKKEKSV